MTKIDIFSGFLGAGKTTLIKKLIREAYAGEKLVLVENEFGEIGIDGGFMEEAGIQVSEINSGCICCSLVGDFRLALQKVYEEYQPDRILIEPSGVGKLSDVVKSVEAVENENMKINSMVTVADAKRIKVYLKNFGEFCSNQIEHAGCIVLSRTADMSQEKLEKTVALLREHNAKAVIITTDWDELRGQQILAAMEQRDTLASALEAMEHEHHHHHHDHDHECHDPHCSCHEHEHEHHHHHHDHDHECDDPHCDCHHHEHEHHDHDHHDHHDHHEHDHDHECDDPNCSCHDHDHEHHHHHHHADEVFVSWGCETAKKFSEEELRAALSALDDEEKCGIVLRAKGIVDSVDGQWFHFDYTPCEIEIRRGGAGVTGRLCVIGSGLHESAVAALFA